MSIQRKNIDIPKGVLKDIGILAAIEETDSKNYIQDNLFKHVKKELKRRGLTPSK